MRKFKRVKSPISAFGAKRHGQALHFPEFSPYTLRHKMATELAARGVSGEVLKRRLGHKSPDLRTTERYIKFDPRHLAEAKSAIEDYLGSLNRLTDRELLTPDTFKILPSPAVLIAGGNGENWISPLSFSRLIVVVLAVLPNGSLASNSLLSGKFQNWAEKSLQMAATAAFL